MSIEIFNKAICLLPLWLAAGLPQVGLHALSSVCGGGWRRPVGAHHRGRAACSHGPIDHRLG